MKAGSGYALLYHLGSTLTMEACLQETEAPYADLPAEINTSNIRERGCIICLGMTKEISIIFTIVMD